MARRALLRGTLIIAAAGNESRRPSLIRPVGHPANCPSIVAVAALDPALRAVTGATVEAQRSFQHAPPDSDVQ